MAAFCSPHFYKAHQAGPEPVAIKGIFRFLDDLHNDVALQNALEESLKQHQTPVKPTFTPRFDISETETAYHLNGELPGLSKSNIDIDFTDAQTITIKGTVDRVASPYHQQTTFESADEETTLAEQRPASPHQATVEDDFEDLAAETNSTTTAASSSDEKSCAEKVPETTKTQPKIPEPQAKYWMSERKFGQFARSFKFRKTVDVAAVTASLENGVLSVVVPKKNESRKILVH